MKIKLVSILLIACQSFVFGANGIPEQAIYLDSSQPVPKRVENLMSLMTLEEKIAQMCQYVGLEHMRDAEKNITEEELLNGHARGFYKGLHSTGVERMVTQGEIGSFLHVLTPEEANHLQKLAEKSRLKIPLLIGIDAIHGNGLVSGSTIYPSPIGMASTFAPALIEKASRQTAVEMRATGSHWAFTPNIEIACDARWGRVGETFGEDPYLVSRMGVAAIKGLQTDNITGVNTVLACAKHLVAGGIANNGTNAGPVELSEGKLRNSFLPPFKAAIQEAQPFTLMPAHNELNGIPCHANKWLMSDIMRNEYGFDGFIVSDWMDMEAISTRHRIAENATDAFFLSVDAGVDMHMHGPVFSDAILKLIKEGKLTEERINKACAKILEAKFRLGLFENRYVTEGNIKRTVFTKEHQQTALEIARRSIVLLKNENILPIDTRKFKKILITGPNANNQSIMGDWVFEQPEKNVSTILKGIKKEASDIKVNYVDVGWNLRALDDGKIEEAIQTASSSDLAIVVVGEDSFRQHWKEKTCGENRDRMDITLWGKQNYLVESIHKTGIPTIVILINGRPLATEWISENIPAIIEAWEPGSMGGKAVAEILFGKVNPSGKLPITIPRHVGQISTVYNHKPSQFLHPYIDGNKTPLYSFGYGLSYTSFKYDHLKVNKTDYNAGEEIEVTVNVSNTGEREGEEVVQLYIRDDFSNTTRPVKELKRFQRILLDKGESKVVTFTLNKEDLSYYNHKAEYVLESGSFTVMVGGSSLDTDLQKVKFNIK
ncbi:glycoside hydrolase family 3 N-terminal domain-containing protein [Bacteroides sp. GM023]|uniref:glycoside hydrolase family 3 N-terminal domain-containing protein n=1 Tax=Bacteroides sp. GM023 TaxID=2723058 RepID=UPI00168AE761|nr:glycoside hydrolase family 3 N-terminal domain-containing protein [Bacteroides sp. GM023]MBD3590061.1 beta-glucosidase [Bacteroides sp. GM023]